MEVLQQKRNGTAVTPFLRTTTQIAEGKCYKSTNYDAFKLYPSNRKVSDKKRGELKAAMEKRQLVSIILVNEKLFVIDGQHRLAACKELGKPFYFVVKKGLTEADIPAYNTTTKNWVFQDYFDAFVEGGLDEYMKLNEVMLANDLRLSQSLLFYAGMFDYYTRSSRQDDPRALFTIAFESGGFQMNHNFDPTGLLMKRFCEIKEGMREVVSPKDYARFCYTPAFTKACLFLLQHEKYNHQTMLGRLNSKSANLIISLGYSQKKDVLRSVMQRIYNFGRHSNVVFNAE